MSPVDWQLDSISSRFTCLTASSNPLTLSMTTFVMTVECYLLTGSLTAGRAMRAVGPGRFATCWWFTTSVAGFPVSQLPSVINSRCPWPRLLWLLTRNSWVLPVGWQLDSRQGHQGSWPRAHTRTALTAPSWPGCASPCCLHLHPHQTQNKNSRGWLHHS